MLYEHHSELIDILDVASSALVYVLRNDREVPLIVDIVSIHFASAATFSLDIYLERSGVEHFILNASVAAGVQIRQELFINILPQDTLRLKGTLGSSAIVGVLNLNYRIPTKWTDNNVG